MHHHRQWDSNHRPVMPHSTIPYRRRKSQSQGQHSAPLHLEIVFCIGGKKLIHKLVASILGDMTISVSLATRKRLNTPPYSSSEKGFQATEEPDVRGPREYVSESAYRPGLGAGSQAGRQAPARSASRGTYTARSRCSSALHVKRDTSLIFHTRMRQSDSYSALSQRLFIQALHIHNFSNAGG